MRFVEGKRTLLTVSALAMTLTVVPISAQRAPESVDYDAIYRIKQEGFENSRVMEIMSWLTDVYGPRLTNSPGFRKAGEWAVGEMTRWGLANVKLEPFGPFGRGWSNDKFYMTATTPGASFAVIGYPQAWTTGTAGVVSGEAVVATIETADDFAAYKGKLRGKFVLLQPLRDVNALWNPPARRFSEEELRDMERDMASEARPAGRGTPGARAGGPGRAGGPAVAAPGAGRGPAQSFARTRMKFFESEGVLAVVSAGRGDGGTVFVQSGPVGSREPGADPGLPSVTIAVEHYGRIARTLDKDLPVRIEMEVKNTFYDDTMSFNVVGEIPGTDQADELVMLGAHFDSWHGGTGATDNAAGSAVMLEAIRILKQSGLRPRRTVRIGLWGGEEQGLIGSREYVAAHFANRTDMRLKPAHDKLSGYFNVDNGTGAIRGIYLQGNEAVSPVFEAWMKPFRNIGMTTLTIRNTGGTDHLSFDRVGLPGFQFIQDPVEYSTRTHHSNMDVYERIQEADMKQNAVIVAAFVYHTANREERLPRKPLPAPQGGGRGTMASGS